MKFKVNRDHFASGLAQVLNVVGSKATMPILGNVLIEAAKDSVTLTTTNLDLGIRCKLKADVKEAGAITLPVKRLTTIVRELPNVDVSLDTTPSHQAKLSSGGSTFRISGIAKDEFPPLPDFGEGDTVWMGAIDGDGCAVSYIQSIFWEYGSGVVLPRTQSGTSIHASSAAPITAPRSWVTARSSAGGPTPTVSSVTAPPASRPARSAAR